MKLALIAHRECWRDPSSSSGFSSSEGFPEQIAALAGLFDSLVLAVPVSSRPCPAWSYPITHSRVVVEPLSMPVGQDTLRKLDMLRWLPVNFAALDRVVRNADAVHTLMTSDIASFGIVLALFRGKRLFVRHCGYWGHPYSWIDALAQSWLARIASDVRVVMATGRDPKAPSARNPAVGWIFSSAMSEIEMAQRRSHPWTAGTRLRLVTASRLTTAKSVSLLIEALLAIRATGIDAVLHVAGDGPERWTLESRAKELGLAERVKFHGQLRRDRVLELMESCHIFVFATRQEGFPKALLEAVGCGLPCVAPAVSSIPSLVDGLNGALLEIVSSKTIAEAVLRIANRPESWAGLSAQSQLRSRSYTLERWGAEMGQRLTQAWGPLRGA